MPRVPAQPPIVRLRLEDASGTPLKNTVYGLEWRGIPGRRIASQTDDAGVLTEPIPAGAKSATLFLSEPSWTVVITVTPFGDASTPDGLAARLENLDMIALPPTTALASVDPHALSLAVQRYKAFKGIDGAASLDEVRSLLSGDHDSF